MDDSRITELLFARDETALTELSEKYGRYCKSIALNVLGSREDSEECFADALEKVWQKIPPARPGDLKLYLARITRYIAVSRLRMLRAEKRGGGSTAGAMEELDEIASPGSPEEELDASEMRRLINGFVSSLEERQRYAFVRRYWFLESSEQIGSALGMKPGSVDTMLCRIRKDLRKYLKKEGYEL